MGSLRNVGCLVAGVALGLNQPVERAQKDHQGHAEAHQRPRPFGRGIHQAIE